ncbi:ORF1320 [White spot syndrome virus]|uniref:ORF1320 n=1 Tax=White spot syndrome virus TaxID=342409 RepID=A0A2D3I6Z0_9VIRU|nr:ORF1320 [White spot syndrome virus]
MNNPPCLCGSMCPMMPWKKLAKSSTSHLVSPIHIQEEDYYHWTNTRGSSLDSALISSRNWYHV